MGAVNTDQIKSYLVGLGFEVDDTALAKFNSAIGKATGVVEKHTSLMSNAWVKAGGAVTAATLSIIGSTGILLQSLAKADLGYDLYAMKMFMARDAAKQFKIVTDAMGHSLNEIAWNPELNRQYRDLMETASRIKMPEDYGKQMHTIRELGHEFTRFKIEASYAVEMVGYEIAKGLNIAGATQSFKEFNAMLMEKMPIWAKKVADVIVPIINIIKNFGKALWEVSGYLKEFWDTLSDPAKIAVFGTALTTLFIVGGPVTKAIVGIGLLVVGIAKMYEYLNTPGESWPALEGLLAFIKLIELAIRTTFGLLTSTLMLASSGGGRLDEVIKMWEEERVIQKGKAESIGGNVSNIVSGRRGKKDSLTPEELKQSNEEIRKVSKGNKDMEALMLAVRQMEGATPRSEGGSGELGIWQFMKETGEQYGLASDEDRKDIPKSTEAASKFLSSLMVKHGGDVNKVLREYNGGNIYGKKKPENLAINTKYGERGTELFKQYRNVSPSATGGVTNNKAEVNINVTANTEKEGNIAGKAAAKSFLEETGKNKNTSFFQMANAPGVNS